ncbi:MAG: signal peptidase I, partial [Clostridiales bacterium]|nr:signal peptidase I [Clostridiales bacterium]
MNEYKPEQENDQAPEQFFEPESDPIPEETSGQASGQFPEDSFEQSYGQFPEQSLEESFAETYGQMPEPDAEQPLEQYPESALWPSNDQYSGTGFEQNQWQDPTKKRKNPVLNFIKEFVIIVGMAVVLAFLLKSYVVDSRVVPSSSMYPTVQIGDRFIISKLSYIRSDPGRGDIICFDPPPEMPRKDELLKRVIGLPGETLEVRDGRVYINGKGLVEPYLAENPRYNYGPIEIPENCYFMLGDNRNLSTDSHLWNYPFIHKEAVEGKVLFRYWPLARFGLPYTKADMPQG